MTHKIVASIWMNLSITISKHVIQYSSKSRLTVYIKFRYEIKIQSIGFIFCFSISFFKKLEVIIAATNFVLILESNEKSLKM